MPIDFELPVNRVADDNLRLAEFARHELVIAKKLGVVADSVADIISTGVAAGTGTFGARTILRSWSVVTG